MFFHGSKNNLEIGETLISQVDTGYTSYEECISIENAFEYFRPEDKISRKTAIYLVDNPNIIEKVGGYDDYIYEIDPIGNIQKSDLYWYNEVAKEMGDFFEIEELTEKAKKYIENYWNSVESLEKNIEYRVESAVIKNEFNLKEKNNLESLKVYVNKKSGEFNKNTTNMKKNKL